MNIACGSAPPPARRVPVEVARSWAKRTGVEIVDGIGSTEMLHIFVSNRPGAVRYGVTGKPVPGYKARLVDELRQEVPAGEVGEMEVSGPTSAHALLEQPRQDPRAPFSANGSRPATSSARTRTATTSIAAGPTTC